LESELLSLHTQLYRTETYLKQKETDRAESSLGMMRQAVSNLIQSNFYVLKNDITELNSTSFLKMITDLETEREAMVSGGKKTEVSSQIKSRIRDQYNLLKQFSSSYMNIGQSASGGAKPLSQQIIPQNEEVISEVLSYLAVHSYDKEVQKLCSPGNNRSPSADKLLINSLKSKILEGSTRPKSPTSRKNEQSARHTTEHKEFSVYSDFSFQSPIEENADAKKLETIKEDLKHVELDDILRISSLPISIQSDDEYRNFEL